MNRAILVIFGFVVSLLLSLEMHAQDVIYMRDGTSIEGKVLEVSPGDIRYSRADNPAGPKYTVRASEILVIKYANEIGRAHV